MLVREARPADAEAIARVHVDSWRAAYRAVMPDHVLAHLDVAVRVGQWQRVLGRTDGCVFVLEDADGVRGFCHLCPARDTDLDSWTIAELTSIYLEPRIWGSGYGRRLCARALHDVAERGFTAVILWVLEVNTRARRFYECLEFVLDGGAKVNEYCLREVRYGKVLTRER